MEELKFFPYLVREFIQDSEIRKIIIRIYDCRTKAVVLIQLPYAQKYYNKKINKWKSGEAIEIPLFPDYEFITKLVKLKVISKVDKDIKFNPYTETCIQVENPKFIEKLYEWIKYPEKVFHYGLFSFNLATGEAYWVDSRAKFRKGRGKYQLFRAFLENPKHELSFYEILNITTGKMRKANKKLSQSELDKVHDAVRAIRKDLGIEKGMRLNENYIFPSGMAYTMLSGTVG